MRRLLHGCHILALTISMYAGVVCITLGGMLFFPFLALYYRSKHAKTIAQATLQCIWWYGKIWTYLLQALVPVTVVYKTATLPDASIIITNHQSYFDTYCFGYMLLREIVFVVRGWPFRIPWYRGYMQRAGYLNSEVLSGEELLGEAAKKLAAGFSVAVYPEGTRSPNGKLGRYHAGAFLLAMQTGRPIVPFCLSGMNRLLPKKAWFLRPAHIRITLFEPIYPQDFLQYGDEAYRFLRNEVKRRMQQEISL